MVLFQEPLIQKYQRLNTFTMQLRSWGLIGVMLDHNCNMRCWILSQKAMTMCFNACKTRLMHCEFVYVWCHSGFARTIVSHRDLIKPTIKPKLDAYAVWDHTVKAWHVLIPLTKINKLLYHIHK